MALLAPVPHAARRFRLNLFKIIPPNAAFLITFGAISAIHFIGLDGQVAMSAPEPAFVLVQ
jgi:hypothetical protein